MTNLFKTITLAGFGCLTLGVAAAQAQNTTRNKLGEFDEIVIKHKSDKDTKITIEIKDGDVLIDGKKADQFSNPDISVFRRRITPVDGNNFSFDDGTRGSFDMFNGFGNGDNGNEEESIPLPGNKAVLGVITEKTAAKGATVKTVARGSAAAKAGLKPGDIIVKVDDKAINEPKELFETIGGYKPGDKVTVLYIRNKKESKVKVTLEERKNEGGEPDFGVIPIPRNRGNVFGFPQPQDRGFSWFGNEDNDVKLGIQVQDMEDESGAQIMDILKDSPAEKAGLKTNDIITELAGESIKSARDVSAVYRANRNKGTITATIKRNGQRENIEIKVPKKLNKVDL
ncbi:MAG TPA: PDZ domain-containing protein [Chitinophaga sp.]|uniref:PDZ domain-containing protein n=1 Tax=Chitinophaga sp. TaxID=1869181 RepID=UPI002B56B187|nr:PDZ domain-containing protein [Chitinophaga sp.]HVI44093.1 PDZ domain-containing protein [Chitinophaga sp.]